MDEIQVNGAIRRHWDKVKDEIRQIMSQCKNLLGKDDLRREDFVEYMYGSSSPLFGLFRDRLNWDHRHFLQFQSTCMHLSSNQCEDGTDSDGSNTEFVS